MYFVLVVLALCVLALLLDRWKPSTVFAFTAVILLLSGSLDVDKFLQEISNPSIIAVFLLLILTTATSHYFYVTGFFDRLCAGATSARSFNLRMGVSVAALSSV